MDPETKAAEQEKQYLEGERADADYDLWRETCAIERAAGVPTEATLPYVTPEELGDVPF